METEEGKDPLQEIATQAEEAQPQQAGGARKRPLGVHTSDQISQAQIQPMEINWSLANAGWRLGLYCVSEAEDKPAAKPCRHLALAPGMSQSMCELVLGLGRVPHLSDCDNQEGQVFPCSQDPFNSSHQRQGSERVRGSTAKPWHMQLLIPMLKLVTKSE